MALFLKATWTALTGVALIVLTIGLQKAGYFEWDLAARARVPVGRQMVLAASAALVIVGIAAVPVIKAPMWTVFLVIAVAGVCARSIYTDWLPLVALAIAYPLAIAVVVGYWATERKAQATSPSCAPNTGSARI